MTVNDKINFILKYKESIFLKYIKEKFPRYIHSIKKLNVENNNSDWFTILQTLPLTYDNAFIYYEGWKKFIYRLTYDINKYILIDFIKNRNLKTRIMRELNSDNIDNLIDDFLQKHPNSPKLFFFYLYLRNNSMFWHKIHLSYIKKYSLC